MLYYLLILHLTVLVVQVFYRVEGYPEHGLSATLSDNQAEFPYMKMEKITGWKHDGPAQYLNGLDFDGSTIVVKKSGIYYISYQFLLKDPSGATQIGAVINDDIYNNVAIHSDTYVEHGTDLSAAGFLKLKSEDKVNIYLQSNNINQEFQVCKGTSLSFRFHNYAPSSPGFLFSLAAPIKLSKDLKRTKLGGWITKEYGQFYTSSAFRQGQKHFQIPANGIYIICANILVINFPNNKGIIDINLYSNNVLLSRVFKYMLPGKTHTINLQEMFYLTAESHLYLEIATNGDRANVLDTSTWSVLLIKEKSEMYNGFHYELKNSIDISYPNKYFQISPWLLKNGTGNFASVSLVDEETFNTEQTSFFYVVASLKFQLRLNETLSTGSFIKISFSGPSNIKYLEKSFKSHMQDDLDSNKTSTQTYSVDLSGVFELSKSLPVSVALSIPPCESIRIFRDSTFSVMQVTEIYPGVYSHISNVDNKYTNQYTVPFSWEETAGIGAYDFTQSFNASTGKYRVTTPGVYLVTANIVIEDIDQSQVSVLMSKNNELKISDGVYILEKYPALKSTLNLGGFFEMKSNDEIGLHLKAKDDEDWKILTTGFSAVYFGIKPSFFQSKLQDNVVGRLQTNKFVLSPWNNGNKQLLDKKSFQVKTAGIHFVIVSIIFKDTIPNLSESDFKIYVGKNGVMIPGLMSKRKQQQESNSKDLITDFTLFLSGSFYAEVADNIEIYVETGIIGKYFISQESTWGMVFVDTLKNVKGTYTTLEDQKYFITQDPWQSFGDYKFRDILDEGLYRSEKLNFDQKKVVKIKSQGIYLISANIDLSYPNDINQLFKVTLSINTNEGENNGLLIWQKSKWKTISVHIIGGILLNKNDEVTLKITVAETVASAEEVGFSVLAIPEAKPPTTFAAILKTSQLISASGSNMSEWDFAGTLSSSNFDKQTGVMSIETDGYFMLTSALSFLNGNKLIDGVKVSIMVNGKVYKNFTADLRNKNGSLTMNELMKLKYNDKLNLRFLPLYNKTEMNTLYTKYINYNSSINGTVQPANPYEVLDVMLSKEGSTLSLVFMPNFEPTDGYVAKFIQDLQIDKFDKLEQLNTGWVVENNPLVNGNKYFVNKAGIYFLMLKILVKNVTDSVELSFTADKKIICSTIYRCVVAMCDIYFKAICMGKINESENIQISVKTRKPGIIISKDSNRLVTFMRASSVGFALSSVTNMSNEITQSSPRDWYAIGDWIYSENHVNGLFIDKVIVYRNQILLKRSGVYQFAANVQIKLLRDPTMRKCANASNCTPFPTVVTYTKVKLCLFVNGKCDSSLSNGMDVSNHVDIFTINLSGAREMMKWENLELKLKIDNTKEGFEVLKGTTWSGIVTEDAPYSLVNDPGPIMMSQTLLPVNYSNSMMGVQKSWTCHAYGDGKITYRWYKDDKVYLVQQTKIGTLTIDGFINDTGVYYCEAEISSIVFLSSKIHIDIYDIDECALRVDHCSTFATCTNTLGSFSCKCNVGFNGDGTICENINECLSPGACVDNSLCEDLFGTYECKCKDGFTGETPKIEPCNDVDECNSSLLSNCDSTHGICVNTPGSYNCLCDNGWIGDGKTCADYDECSAMNFTCPVHSTCVNLNGTYDCTCNQGYKQNDTDCIDIDECDVTGNATFDIRDKCVANTVCVNLEGTYGCECMDGFTGIGTVSCIDTDECVQQKCNAQADCVNIIGGYTCKCRTGWQGDGYRCSDIDECVMDPYICPNGTCVNEIGDYFCQCNQGFRQNGLKKCTENNNNGVTAAQTDPCETDANSFKCICNDPAKRQNNILCNGLFVALIILVLVAVVVILFVIKYMKSRKLMKIRPAKVHKDKYIEMENESEL